MLLVLCVAGLHAVYASIVTRKLHDLSCLPKIPSASAVSELLYRGGFIHANETDAFAAVSVPWADGTTECHEMWLQSVS